MLSYIFSWNDIKGVQDAVGAHMHAGTWMVLSLLSLPAWRKWFIIQFSLQRVFVGDLFICRLPVISCLSTRESSKVTTERKGKTMMHRSWKASHSARVQFTIEQDIGLLPEYTSFTFLITAWTQHCPCWWKPPSSAPFIGPPFVH